MAAAGKPEEEAVSDQGAERGLWERVAGGRAAVLTPGACAGRTERGVPTAAPRSLGSRAEVSRGACRADRPSARWLMEVLVRQLGAVRSGRVAQTARPSSLFLPSLLPRTVPRRRPALKPKVA